MRRSHPARAAEARGRVPLPVLVALVALLAAAMRAPSGISMPARPSARRPRDGRPAQAICDAFDAMISGRPYSTPKSPRQALAELRRCAGRQFDPELVALFEQVMSGALCFPLLTPPADATTGGRGPRHRVGAWRSDVMRTGPEAGPGPPALTI